MSSRDPKYTLAIARIALEKIAALGLPADPPSFAVWYAYCAAQNPEINQKLNQLLAGNTRLSIGDVQQIFEEHLSPAAALTRVERAGADLAAQVEHIVNLIEPLATGAAAYQADLDAARGRLGGPADRDTIRAIVRNLVQSTQEMERRNQALETGLRVAKEVIADLQDDLTRTRRDSERDALTMLATRKHFETVLSVALAKATAAGGQLAVLLIDVDNFKAFNDTHGHQTGDDVLRLIAHTLSESLGAGDLAARYGGDEMAALLPDADLARAERVAETVRRSIAGKIVRRRSTGEELGRLTVSIGIAGLAPDDDSETLVARADQALYGAKKNGRNALCSNWAAAAPASRAMTGRRG